MTFLSSSMLPTVVAVLQVLLVTAIDIPLVVYSPSLHRRAAIGLGDVDDVTYSVLVNLSGTLTPLVLDSGSADLWAISHECKSPTCSGGDLPLYSTSKFNATPVEARLLYGDSLSGTFANGRVGSDAVSLPAAGSPSIEQGLQYIASVTETNTSIIQSGATGLFGLGFPVNSFIWSRLFRYEHGLNTGSLRRRDVPSFPVLDDLYRHPKSLDYKRAPFPSLDTLYPHSKPTSPSRRQDPATNQQEWTKTILASFSRYGPIVARHILSQSNPGPNFEPGFTVSFQRHTIAPPSSSSPSQPGLLTLFEFPQGLTRDSFTWAPVRRYSPAEGGLYSPSETEQVYPIAWEITIDDIYFDGQLIPKSRLSDLEETTALVDTGNSLLRGPRDIVQEIRKRLSLSNGGTFGCETPHVLAFKIGGKMFPVDPRDFIAPAKKDGVKECIPNLVPTDPPSAAGTKGYKYSWSLGVPFLKSVTSSFHYGNITYPTEDPPAIGLRSTIPDPETFGLSTSQGADSEAGKRIKEAVDWATGEGKGAFYATSNPAPTGTALPSSSNVDGKIPNVNGNGGNGNGGSGNGSTNGAVSTEKSILLRWCLIVTTSLFFGL